MKKQTLIINATVEDLVEALQEGLGLGRDTVQDNAPQVKKHYVYGIAGLMQLLGCSRATACRIKASGVLDPAISQQGKIIVIDADLALDLLNVQQKRKGKHRYGNYKKSPKSPSGAA